MFIHTDSNDLLTHSIYYHTAYKILPYLFYDLGLIILFEVVELKKSSTTILPDLPFWFAIFFKDHYFYIDLAFRGEFQGGIEAKELF